MGNLQVSGTSQGVLAPTVRKHAGAIHIKNDISCLQRKAWNVLLHNAYDEFPDSNVQLHTITVRDLMDLAGFDSKNVKYLKDALEDMVTTPIKWDIIDHKGKSDWGVTTALAGASIKDGVCSYAYSPQLKSKLYNPELYARIDLLIISRFSSGHALALYENCARYRAIRQSPVLPLSLFRELLGVESTASYDEFKILNRAVIQPAMKEINSISDLHVEVELHREKRKVVGVKFLIHENTQGALAIDSPSSFNHELLTKLQANFSLTEAQAKEALALHSEDRIDAVMDYVQTRYLEGKIKNGVKGLAPYFLKVLRDGDIKVAKTALDKLVAPEKKKREPQMQGDLLQDDATARREFNIFRRSQVDEILSGLSENDRDELHHNFAQTIRSNRLLMKKWSEYLVDGTGSAMVVNNFYTFVADKYLPPYEDGLQLFISVPPTDASD
ncbi:replication initiation protein [Pseudomonas sp. WS 5532]|uniref:replication initiation protein n=1 Tax=Pseudomonas sp. WS 5532 TaxID=2717495 RepID=UPI001476621B|nr:replication initiation protein [Pseudomonas sp. WS 5532]NMX77615.1 replication initiation protein [Pseudomonas sp. WS 5532]